MADRDRFELDLTAALSSYAEEAPTQVRPMELAGELAAAYPHRRGVLDRWRVDLRPVRRLAWIVAVALLLAALGATALFVGARRTPVPAPALLATPAPLAATIAPPWTPAPLASPIDLPPGKLTADTAATWGVPVVTPSELGRISWTVWLPSGVSSGGIPLNTPHGPVLLQGENLIWRSPSGDWKASPILGSARWPASALGDDLILAGGLQPARIHWTGSDWIHAGTIQDLAAFPLGGIVGGAGGVIAFGPEGMLRSSDGIRFIRVTQGPDCVASVVATGVRFVALSGPCPKGNRAMTDGIEDLSVAQRFFEPMPWASTDGLSWQPIATTSPFGSGSTVLGIASRAGREVAIGMAPPVGKTSAAAASLEATVWMSDDGLAWRRLPALPEAPLVDASSWGTGFRTIAAGDPGWLIFAFDTSKQAWTSADGVTWKPLHGQPGIWGGYESVLGALGPDLILAAAVGQQPVAIGTVLGP